MRKLLVAVALVGLGTAGADDPKPARGKKEKPAVSLKVGDRAPALKADKWLQGKEVKKFERGKVYVVEFWATWCGPCIAFMPHGAELQARYKDRGVTFIYFTARDPDNTEEKVAAFVKRRGPKLKYAFAYSDDRTTYDDWVTAAGKEGVPWTFVVDRSGRIAYVGHPMYLGVVLPKVVAGAKPQEVREAVAKVQEDFRAMDRAFFPKSGPDPEAGLKALAEFEAKYPAMANSPVILRGKLTFLPKAGRIAEAKKVAEAVMAKAIKQEDPSALGQVSALLRNGPGKESKELLAVAVKAAEALVKLQGANDARALINLASTYSAAGEKAKAREYARKAVKAAAEEPAELRRTIERQARALDGGKKEDDK